MYGAIIFLLFDGFFCHNVRYKKKQNERTVISMLCPPFYSERCIKNTFAQTLSKTSKKKTPA